MSSAPYQRLAPLAALLALLLLPELEARAYDFAPSCAPLTEHDSQQSPPNALIMLDNSCSMGDEVSPGVTKMSVARTVIKELATATHKSGTCSASDLSGCDDVYLGLGWFSIEAGVDVPPADDTRGAINSTVDGYGFRCQTQHGAAAHQIYDSAELQSSDGVGIAIIVTDGAPYQDSPYGSTRDTIEETLHYLCAARDRAGVTTRTFMVGFGAGTNKKMNGVFAAAGGTGMCCIDSGGVPCTYQPSEIRDPCALPRRNSTQLDVTSLQDQWDALRCEGAIQADTGQALKDELLAILDEIACTYPLDVPTGYLRYPGADEDPAATRVEFDHTLLGDDLRIPAYDASNPNAFYDYLVNQRGISAAVADPYKGEGWTFADPLRRSVKFSDKLCAEVRSNNVQVTRTQVACLCEHTGDMCDVLCQDMNGDDRDDLTGAACLDLDGESIQVGRCRIGTVECRTGVEFCAADFSRQPEVCNGLDDDCDGSTDNLEHADPARDTDDPADSAGREYFEWNGDAAQLASHDLDAPGLFCAYQSVCRCEAPHLLSERPNRSSPDPDHEWKLLLQSTDDQRAMCACVPGLTHDAPATLPLASEDASPEAQDAAACTIASPIGSRPPSLPLSALLGLCGMIGALALRRRRAR